VSAALAAWISALAVAFAPQCGHLPGFDCRYDGARVCLPGNADGFTPGWYGDDNCWPGAVYCPPSDSPPDTTVTCDSAPIPVPDNTFRGRISK
jgi:hypothetical protein